MLTASSLAGESFREQIIARIPSEPDIWAVVVTHPQTPGPPAFSLVRVEQWGLLEMAATGRWALLGGAHGKPYAIPMTSEDRIESVCEYISAPDEATATRLLTLWLEQQRSAHARR